ncbi:hypothetical protein MC7420_7307 [Coleofasciculus chthonoplastes PCC 7420]|uniref:Uncharacterized protein n=1 Tax=Coleofasciculus chthonoplastes PCC 7420 TaxID=118168 RepID=B4VI45_9CYAN|nr:hypothetical protein MC7420_7307 [Coleofasciculus chthonoplastes PCC 7420]
MDLIYIKTDPREDKFTLFDDAHFLGQFYSFGDLFIISVMENINPNSKHFVNPNMDSL